MGSGRDLFDRNSAINNRVIVDRVVVYDGGSIKDIFHFRLFQTAMAQVVLVNVLDRHESEMISLQSKTKTNADLNTIVVITRVCVIGVRW